MVLSVKEINGALTDGIPIRACVNVLRNTVEKKRKITSTAYLTSKEYKHIDNFTN